jgi:uncharacterized glyoxalase superfamily protein PhnB
MGTAPTIYPFMRYRKAPAAIEFLTNAFGFRKVMVVPNEDGSIAHAELSIGNGMIMIGSQRDDDSLGTTIPNEVGGITQGCYIAIADADAHHRRAKAAGAEILAEPHNTDYGSREYAARDPEGHRWSFGTYRPEVPEP